MAIEKEARLALESMSAAERDLCRLAICPPWRHAAFAASEAALVASPALVLPFRFALLAAVFVAIGLIVQSDRRRLGVFINGYRRGRTRLVVLPLLAVILGLYLASVYLEHSGQPRPIILAIAVVAFVVAYVGSVFWQRVFVNELGI